MSKKIPKGWVKISEFATLTGLSVKTIMAAMKRGTIPPSEVVRVGSSATSPYYLNPQTVAKSWYDNLNANHPLTSAVRTALESYIISIDHKSKIKKTGKTKATDQVKETIISSLPITDAKMPLAEAQRLEREAKAKIALLELQEKEGSLVARERINNQLFGAGKELRDALLAIPDRITDLIMAEDNRTKVHNIIYDAIATELQKLADYQIGINK